MPNKSDPLGDSFRRFYLLLKAFIIFGRACMKDEEIFSITLNKISNRTNGRKITVGLQASVSMDCHKQSSAQFDET